MFEVHYKWNIGDSWDRKDLDNGIKCGYIEAKGSEDGNLYAFEIINAK